MPSSSSKAQKTKSASRSYTGGQTTAYNSSASAGGSGSGSGSSGAGNALYGGYIPLNPDGTERDPFGSGAYDSDDSEEDGNAQMLQYHEREARYHDKVTANNNLGRENARRMAEQTRYGSTGGSSSVGASSRSGSLAGGGPSSHSRGSRKPPKTVKFNSEVSPPLLSTQILSMR